MLPSVTLSYNLCCGGLVILHFSAEQNCVKDSVMHYPGKTELIRSFNVLKRTNITP